MNRATPKIGFIGIGLMGKPMSLRLINAGFEVLVWNRSAEKCADLSKAGAQVADSIAQLTQHSDIIMLSVTDTHAVEDVVWSAEGVAQHATAEKLIIDFSSIAPDTTRHFAQRLKAQCGCGWIDAPVSGGVAGAEQGTLVIMAGGNADHIDAVRPVLAHVSQRVTRMGDVGSGQATKIINQMIVSCNVLVLAEVLALAEKAGVDSRQIPAALKGGFADSIPLQLTGTRMAQRDFEEVKWHVKTLLKDLNLSQTLAQQTHSTTPMSALAQHLYQTYCDQGYASQDPATLISCYDKH